MNPRNTKCHTCLYKETRGVVVNVIGSKSNDWCNHKNINLNNIIVKSCTSYTNPRREVESEDEFSPEEVFKNIPPQQGRLRFVPASSGVKNIPLTKTYFR